MGHRAIHPDSAPWMPVDVLFPPDARVGRTITDLIDRLYILRDEAGPQARLFVVPAEAGQRSYFAYVPDPDVGARRLLATEGAVV